MKSGISKTISGLLNMPGKSINHNNLTMADKYSNKMEEHGKKKHARYWHTHWKIVYRIIKKGAGMLYDGLQGNWVCRNPVM